jgi:hypothetical protein
MHLNAMRRVVLGLGACKSRRSANALACSSCELQRTILRNGQIVSEISDSLPSMADLPARNRAVARTSHAAQKVLNQRARGRQIGCYA